MNHQCPQNPTFSMSILHQAVSSYSKFPGPIPHCSFHRPDVSPSVFLCTYVIFCIATHQRTSSFICHRMCWRSFRSAIRLYQPGRLRWQCLSFSSPASVPSKPQPPSEPSRASVYEAELACLRVRLEHGGACFQGFETIQNPRHQYPVQETRQCLQSRCQMRSPSRCVCSWKNWKGTTLPTKNEETCCESSSFRSGKSLPNPCEPHSSLRSA